MQVKRSNTYISVLFSILFLTACQKELNFDSSTAGGGGPLDGKKPRLGTTWTYNYNVYQQDGSLLYSKVLIYKAKTAEVLGGETWLHIVDVDNDTTVFYLNEKSGGLFQYTNNAANLFCKAPAAVYDTYTSYNEGSSEDFTVKAVGDTISTGVGDVPANYYEGKKAGQLIDLLWYNENAWIVWKIQYRNRSIIPPPFYYKYSSLYISNIEY
jgi:hypothetical protein